MPVEVNALDNRVGFQQQQPAARGLHSSAVVPDADENIASARELPPQQCDQPALAELGKSCLQGLGANSKSTRLAVLNSA